MDRWTEQLIDKLGVMPETLQPHVYKSGDMVYHVTEAGADAEHMTAGNKFTFLWTDSLDTFSWVDALMSYDTWSVRLGQVVRLLDTVPDVFIGAVSEGMISLNGNVNYLDKCDYLAHITWDGDKFTLMDGANGDEHLACTAEGVIERLKWCMRFNSHYGALELEKI